MNIKNLYEGGTEPKFITIDTHPKAFHEDQGCVRIISGEYADVIIQFDVIQAREEKNENGDNIAKFNFNFIICESGLNGYNFEFHLIEYYKFFYLSLFYLIT